MEQYTIDHNNGHKSVYNLLQAEKPMPIAYYAATPPEVVQVLERARKNNQRIRIYLGDLETGRCWNEEHDVYGYVGLSKGHVAYFPIFVNNARSMGGGSLMTDHIIKIKESKGKRVLYQAANFQQPAIEVKEESNHEGYTHAVYIDGELYSNHKSLGSAERLKKKME